jgi:glycosyltransferase involved in cell wall biosynthesis
VGIRVVVLDDNPHVRWQGHVYPVNATFHRFLSAVLDVQGAPVSEIVHCVPLQDASEAPATLPLDERLRVVATAPFDGIAGYLRATPRLLRTNRPILRDALSGADLLWLKLPASNALMAAGLARTAGVRRFGYVAGSARDVAAGRWSGPGGVVAQAVGLAWDLAGRLSTLGAPRVVVGREVVTSLVEPSELRDPEARPWPWHPERLRLAWAGRLVEGKGVERLLQAMVDLPAAELVVLGDGPAAGRLVALAESLGVRGRVNWHGFVADRSAYLDALASADVFVFPSPAEGFPKVVLDAWAVGLPVVASPVGALGAMRGRGLYREVAGSIAEAVTADQEGWPDLRRAGFAFAADHTRPAEAARLVARWRDAFPGLIAPSR